MSFRWDEFEIKFYYPFPVSRVFEAWATGQGLKSFFIEEISISDPNNTSKVRFEDEHALPGDQYSWKWRHGYALTGEFLAVSKDREIVFSFGSMTVRVLLTEQNGQTMLKLIQSGIPTTEEGRIFSYMNCRICWTFFLTNLKSVLLTGQDLRDADPAKASSFEISH